MSAEQTGRLPADAAGVFRIGGELAVHRLGFGAMARALVSALDACQAR
jgi:hypothetical protein